MPTRPIYLPSIIVAAVGLATIASGVLLYYATRPAPASNITAGAAAGSRATHVRGPAKAPVTLEEFGDFQCPPCGRLAGSIQELERQYPSRLRVVFRHFPLATHAFAQQAAAAAEAAALQGRFWQMHDLLYREQANWSNAADVLVLFERFAGMIGLDVERFKRDMHSEEAKARVVADQQRGTSLGVTSTPSIFINNEPLPRTSLNPAGLRAAIDQALKSNPTG